MTASPESVISVKSGAGEPSSTGKRFLLSSCRRRRPRVALGDRRRSLVSPREQASVSARLRARRARARRTIEELDVSGGAPLAKRAGLRRAVELVEAGEADVVVVAYFDRLVRSLACSAKSSSGSSGRAARSSPSTSARSAPTRARVALVDDARHGRRVPSPGDRASAPRREAPRDRGGRPTFPNVPPGLPPARGRRLEAASEGGDGRRRGFRASRQRRDRARGSRVPARRTGSSARSTAQALLTSRMCSASSASASSSTRTRTPRSSTWRPGRRCSGCARRAGDAEVGAAARTARRAPLRDLRRDGW